MRNRIADVRGVAGAVRATPRYDRSRTDGIVAANARAGSRSRRREELPRERQVLMPMRESVGSMRHAIREAA